MRFLMVLLFSFSVQAQEMGPIPLSLSIQSSDFEMGFVDQKNEFTDTLEIRSQVLIEPLEKTGKVRIIFPETQRLRPANIDIGQMLSPRYVQHLDIEMGGSKKRFLELVSQLNSNTLVIENQRNGKQTYHVINDVVLDIQLENSSELNMKGIHLDMNEVHYRNGSYEIDLRAKSSVRFSEFRFAMVSLSDPEVRAHIEDYEAQRLQNQSKIGSMFNRFMRGAGLIKEDLVPMNISGPSCSRLF